MEDTKEISSLGTQPHKAIFDISISFKTELATDDKSARALIDALTEYIRAKLPGSGDPEVSIKER